MESAKVRNRRTEGGLRVPALVITAVLVVVCISGAVVAAVLGVVAAVLIVVTAVLVVIATLQTVVAAKPIVLSKRIYVSHLIVRCGVRTDSLDAPQGHATLGRRERQRVGLQQGKRERPRCTSW